MGMFMKGGDAPVPAPVAPPIAPSSAPSDTDTGDEPDPSDAIFKELKNLMDWGFDASGSYKDDDMIDIVDHKAPVESFKGFGNSPPSLPNLHLVSHDFPVDDLWFGDEGVKSRYWDFGGYY